MPTRYSLVKPDRPEDCKSAKTATSWNIYMVSETTKNNSSKNKKRQSNKHRYQRTIWNTGYELCLDSWLMVRDSWHSASSRKDAKTTLGLTVR